MHDTVRMLFVEVMAGLAHRYWCGFVVTDIVLSGSMHPLPVYSLAEIADVSPLAESVDVRVQQTSDF
jgi:hypothetical protein